MIEIAKLNIPTNILIVENCNIKKISWRNALMQNNEFNVIGVANSINDILYFYEIFHPEIIIVDLTYMSKNGIDIIYKIKESCNNAKIIILSPGKDKKEIISSISTGANAYCLTNISPQSLSLIIKTVAKGACWFDPIAVPELFNCLPKPQKELTENSLTAPLSARELEVLKLLILGKSNTEIAKELIVSVHTAKAHVCNIFHKMQVTDRVQAAVKAIKLGII